MYKGEEVGLYVPDLMVYHDIIVDVKTIDLITDHELGLMINYLRTTGKQLGLVINFKRAKLEWKRVVL